MKEILEYNIQFGHHSVNLLAIIEVIVELMLFLLTYYLSTKFVNRSRVVAIKFKSLINTFIFLNVIFT